MIFVNKAFGTKRSVHVVGKTIILPHAYSLPIVFSSEQEPELVQHFKDNEETMYGFTFDDVLKFAVEIAERNGIKHPFSTTSRKASKN